MGQDISEPAHVPKTGMVFHPAYQGVGVGEVQDERCNVGLPHSLDGVALPAVVVFFAELGQTFRGIQDTEDVTEGVLRSTRPWCIVRINHARPRFLSGRKRQA